MQHSSLSRNKTSKAKTQFSSVRSADHTMQEGSRIIHNPPIFTFQFSTKSRANYETESSAILPPRDPATPSMLPLPNSTFLSLITHGRVYGALAKKARTVMAITEPAHPCLRWKGGCFVLTNEARGAAVRSVVSWEPEIQIPLWTSEFGVKAPLCFGFSALLVT